MLQEITIFYDFLQYFPISVFIQEFVVKLQWLFVSRRKGGKTKDFYKTMDKVLMNFLN